MKPTTLYRFFAGDDLLYVGITGAPSERWKDHEATKGWWSQVTRVTVEHCPTRAGALLAETVAIQYERPRHNIRGRTRRPLPIPDSETIQAVSDALFCNGEERQCWFSPSGIAAYVGATPDLLIASCLALQQQGRIALRFEGSDSLYVAQREAV